MARSIVNILDLSVDEIHHLLDLADDIDQHPEKYQDRCAHKQLATLFFEPSTRTRLSFESAMLALGGQTLGFAGASNTSASKGESVADTIEVISNYVDIIAMRHPKEGAPVVAAMHTSVPLVNAGDGGHFHPTQTLADLLTIRRTKGTVEGLTIGFCGDLKFGRTVHSLIDAMLRYPNNRYILISPEELRLPEYEIDKLKEAGAELVDVVRGGDAGARYPLHDPCAEGAFLQRGGLPSSEGYLYPDPGEAEDREGGYGHPSSAP